VPIHRRILFVVIREFTLVLLSTRVGD
jgi:hypothetical protein